MQHTKNILIFADGACRGNPGPGGWGAIVCIENNFIQELGGAEANTTNNRMELTAAIEAIQFLQRYESAKLEIAFYTDSKYLIQGVSQWIYGWQRNGWRTATGSEVSNKDLWQAFLPILSKVTMKITWHHVPGHAEIPGNERCDTIARQFSNGQRPELFSGVFTEYSTDLTIPDDLAERSERKSKLKKGEGYYLSYVQGTVSRHTKWADCEANVKGRSGAKFKKCVGPEDEKSILRSWGVDPKTPIRSS